MRLTIIHSSSMSIKHRFKELQWRFLNNGSKKSQIAQRCGGAVRKRRLAVREVKLSVVEDPCDALKPIIKSSWFQHGRLVVSCKTTRHSLKLEMKLVRLHPKCRTKNKPSSTSDWLMDGWGERPGREIKQDLVVSRSVENSGNPFMFRHRNDGLVVFALIQKPLSSVLKSSLVLVIRLEEDVYVLRCRWESEATLIWLWKHTISKRERKLRDWVWFQSAKNRQTRLV